MIDNLSPDTSKLEIFNKSEILYEDFFKLDIRVGVILNAVRIPNSKKLLQLEIDLGLQKNRIIVAKLGAVYEPNEIIKKRVVVVANLLPKELAGVESQGMILAVSGPNCTPKILEAPIDSQPGDLIT